MINLKAEDVVEKINKNLKFDENTNIYFYNKDIDELLPIKSVMLDFVPNLTLSQEYDNMLYCDLVTYSKLEKGTTLFENYDIDIDGTVYKKESDQYYKKVVILSNDDLSEHIQKIKDKRENIKKDYDEYATYLRLKEKYEKQRV